MAGLHATTESDTMVSPSYFPIQDLPVELEREIFETAARMRPPSALDLVLVARRVRDW